MKEQIQLIKLEIFRLIKKAKDLETIHWYIAVDKCFENDEFQKSKAGKLRYRLWVLFEKKEDVLHLTSLIEPVLVFHGFVDKDKKWTEG